MAQQTFEAQTRLKSLNDSAVLLWLEHPVIDAWLPAGAAQAAPQDLVRMRIASAITQGLGVLALTFGVLDASSGWLTLSLTSFIGVALALLTLWRLRAGADLHQVALCASGATFVVVVSNATLNGGVEAPALYFLPLVPIVPLCMDAQRQAGVWAVVSALTVAGLWAVEGVLGAPFPQAMPDDAVPLNRTIVIAAACVFVYVAFLLNTAFGAWMRARMLLAEAERIDRILDVAGDAIVRLDAGWVVTAANAAALQLFETPRLAGTPIGAVLPDVARLQDAAGAVELTAAVSGARVPVEAACTFVQDGWVLVIRDIRERVRAHEALQRALHEAKAASTAKSTFLASMSHELRTPLNAVIGYTELITDDVSSGEPPDPRDLEHIVGSARHLLALIDQVLDLAKVESGKMEVERRVVPLSAFLDELAVVGRTLAKARGNSFRASLPPAPVTVSLDEVRTRQIVLNLLSNAAKFCEGGVIGLDATYDEGRLTIEVSDTGIGMTPEQLVAVWEEYRQAEASTQRVYGGTGLGLALARKLSELLGGTITADSERGVGTRFRVELPAAQRATPLTDATRAAAPSLPV